jgi:hypothetical protein
MGGAVSPVVKLFSKTSEQANNAVQAAAGNKPETKVSTSEQEQEAARARSRRRGGRQLLSDARLNPEGGVQTLGGGSNLG